MKYLKKSNSSRQKAVVVRLWGEEIIGSIVGWMQSISWEIKRFWRRTYNENALNITDLCSLNS